MIAAALITIEKKPAVSYTSFKKMKSYLNILAGVMVLAVMIAPVSCQSTNQGNDARDRAAIIDKLYLREPNPAFIAGATRILESCGFKVDLW
jgi:hypothetical protein